MQKKKKKILGKNHGIRAHKNEKLKKIQIQYETLVIFLFFALLFINYIRLFLEHQKTYTCSFFGAPLQGDQCMVDEMDHLDRC